METSLKPSFNTKVQRHQVSLKNHFLPMFFVFAELINIDNLVCTVLLYIDSPEITFVKLCRIPVIAFYLFILENGSILSFYVGSNIVRCFNNN